MSSHLARLSLAGWVALSGFSVSCGTPGEPAVLEESTLGLTGPGHLIHDVRSDYSHIRVRELGSVRTLYFVEPPGLEVRQTSIDLDRPEHLLISYPRYLFASCLLRVPRERVLIVGLGGGAMVHFVRHHFPEVRVDAVEIDPEVVRLAAEAFGTREDARTRLFTEDAFGYLARTRKKYEIIFMDAFLKPGKDTDAKGVPQRLKTLTFLRSLHDRLTPEGVVAFNLVENDETAGDLRSITEAFPTVYVFRVPSSDNLAIVASRDETWRSAAALRARARELDRRMALGFSLESFVDSLVPRSSES